ncbi:hypothetical protein WKW80_08040 [Variovorax humicola]|uniref:ABC-type transport auxiliary lipoprotein component domain-containing protein n=1 Tax=Variovorax humicola TaxID=1769758 RepID=A0ABU8VVZ4_9BURK
MTSRLMSLAAAVFVGYWLAGCTTTAPLAPDAATTAPTSPVPSIRPPAGVAWQPAGSHDYEPQRPGLGSSQRFESAVGWVDVYRYGMGRSNWAMGVADPAFDAQFRSTISEVRQLAQAGQYTELKVGPTRDLRIAGLVFRTVSYQFRRQGRPHESRTFMTGLQGQLLKYRMTFPSPVEGNVDDIARDFIEKHLRNATGAIDAAAPQTVEPRPQG